jgi:hypothetical protein
MLFYKGVPPVAVAVSLIAILRHIKDPNPLNEYTPTPPTVYAVSPSRNRGGWGV